MMRSLVGAVVKSQIAMPCNVADTTREIVNGQGVLSSQPIRSNPNNQQLHSKLQMQNIVVFPNSTALETSPPSSIIHYIQWQYG